MHRPTLALALLAATVLAGCSGEASTPAATPAAERHVFQGQVQAIDRARAVGGVLEDAARRQREAAD